ncbi:PKD domain-containing protein [Pseudomarimonas arenosa]|uniref:chitinase n=1 Tax=Pseudomarimonas arenosa TaxID=2774145 RepID=A0AAW3ZI18_9GAMM|nr:PKD domain-containing protein [Pseudomarimonas arenosa]MBD8524590.1 PKD domain-containing protein [Pseudomarimonas arenosa]
MQCSSLWAVSCANVAEWDASREYWKGHRVQWQSQAYEANWWTRNQNPATHSGQWQEWMRLGACDGAGEPNQPPTARSNGPLTGTVGQALQFSSAGSNDADGQLVSYRWQFGDGNESSQANPSHSYASAGLFTVALTVTDNQGATGSASTTATISSSGGGTGCSGLPRYQAGTGYAQGAHVYNVVSSSGQSVEYVCQIAGWCSSSAAWAYEPGNGMHWRDAWSEVGTCGPGGGNQSPVAQANGPYQALLGSSIAFNSSGSGDPDGSIVAYRWDFGDGSTSSSANPSHTYGTAGHYTVTLTVTDNEGATDSAETAANITTSGGGGVLPHRVLVGYWHNFRNEAGYLPINQVSGDWDIVQIAFAENSHSGPAGSMHFSPAEESDSSFRNGVRQLQARGQKVLISIGGANAHIQLNTTAQRDAFVQSMGDIIASYGFDGIDIDLEGGSMSMNAGDTVANPQTPAIVNMISAIRSLKQRFGSGFLLTMAPETAYVQGGYANFGGIWGAYLPLIHALRTDLTLLHVQHYNTGSITGADDRVYQPATTDFHVALSDMMITGFAAGRNPSNHFPGLRADQVAIGLPASAGAAGSGQTSAAAVHAALNCLIKRTQCGSYQPSSARTDFRGLMTWSINWDEFAGRAFSGPHRAYLDANP